MFGLPAVTALQHQSEASFFVKHVTMFSDRQFEKKIRCIPPDRGEESTSSDECELI
jgi:hypothetical protein